jgi:RNA recognition motif-containing protein
MNKKLYVGGLSFQTTDDTLGQAFAQAGTVVSAVVIKDKFSGRSKGFGFVTFASPEAAQKALELNGKEIEGRTIVVNVAKPREERPAGNRFNDSRPRRQY